MGRFKSNRRGVQAWRRRIGLLEGASGAVPPAGAFLLLESGDYLLLENSKVVLEQGSGRTDPVPDSSAPIIPLVQTMSVVITAADVAPDGTVWAGIDGVVKKSVDGGDSWTDIYTVPGGDIVQTVFIDSRGYIFVGSGSIARALYRSTNGVDFSLVHSVDADCFIWFQNVTEDNEGNLYIGEYSVNDAGNTKIWKSTDEGETWVLKFSYNGGGGGNNHVHRLLVDPVTDWIYACLGDVTYRIIRSKDGGENWTTICTPTFNPLALAIANGRFYVGTDGIEHNYVCSFVDDSDSPALVVEFALPPDRDGYVYGGCAYGDKVAMGTWLPTGYGTYRDIWLYDGYWYSIDDVIAAPGDEGFAKFSLHSHNGTFYVVGQSNTLARKLYLG